MHPALRDANLTGDEIRPLMLVGDQCYRVFAPNWHRLGKRLLTMTTTGQNPAPSTLPERRLITNGGGRQDVTFCGYSKRKPLSHRSTAWIHWATCPFCLAPPAMVKPRGWFQEV